MKIINETNIFRCSECNGIYLNLNEANLCQSNHFNKRNKIKLELATTNIKEDIISAPKKKKKIKNEPILLPAEKDEDIKELNKNIKSNNPQTLADKLMEQYN